jgi:hypothetical protein
MGLLSPHSAFNLVISAAESSGEKSINLHLHITIISVKSIDDDLLVLQQDSCSSWYWQCLTSNVPTMACNSFSYINPIHEAIF